MEADAGTKSYVESIEKEVRRAYVLAEKARAQGKDPEQKVDIPVAEDLAARCEGLITMIFPQMAGSGIAEGIRKLEKAYGKNDERVALKIAEEIAKQQYCPFASKEKAVEGGIRVGVAYLTLAVVTAPLEGITAVKINEEAGGTYLSLFFAGPIRAAGGTASALAVVLADYVRKKMGVGEFKPTELEMERYATESEDYERLQGSQYQPEREESKMIAANCPVCMDGEPTMEYEVSNYRDLPRVQTNMIRGGMCLTLAMICLKAPKVLKRIKKFGKDFDLENWLWLEKYLELQKAVHAEKKKGLPGVQDKAKYVPNTKYVHKVIAGRPVFAHPAQPGGFRLRYGRARTGGMATTAVHPATPYAVDEFMAIGTQMATELPGKGTTCTVCDSIEGPVVKLFSGDVVRLDSTEEAKKVCKKIREVLSLGDLLVPFGEFVFNAHILLPSCFCEEWWAQEVEKALKDKKEKGGEASAAKYGSKYVSRPYPAPTIDEAFAISAELGVPLHPAYNYFWHDISKEELKKLVLWFSEVKKSHATKKADGTKNAGDPDLGDDGAVIALPVRACTKESGSENGNTEKRILEILCVPHAFSKNNAEEGDEKREVKEAKKKDDRSEIEGIAVLSGRELCIPRILGSPGKENAAKLLSVIDSAESTMDAIGKLSGIMIREKGVTRVGMKMGRPEKAERRLMKGRPQCLFPCGEQGGRMRDLMAAYNKGFIEAEVPINVCPSCGKESYFPACPECFKRTEPRKFCRRCGRPVTSDFHCDSPTVRYAKRRIDIKALLDRARTSLKENSFPKLLKSVRGMSGKDKDLEWPEKGLLRAKWDLYTFKEGTVRYDASNLPLTHFKPKEIGVSTRKLREIGYETDMHGKFLENEDQVVELKPQDIILSDNSIFSGADYFLRIAGYVDDLLVRFYGLEPFYGLKKKEDLVGQLVIGLAPHTSAGIIGRIIGFSPARAGYAHPYWHAAKRRDCDGDEDSVMLLMDALLNFSRKYLPSTRGAATMDACLVLTTKLDPEEIDDEAWNMDSEDIYPLEFYYDTLAYKMPWELTKKITTAASLIGKPEIFHLKFTHDTSDINDAPFITRYVNLEAMMDKVTSQLALGDRIRAVKVDRVAEVLLETHFLLDIKGNLRMFSQQKVRCLGCNAKYRRIPLAGKCASCGGKLSLTVHEGTVEKYIEPSKRIMEKYRVSSYLMQQFAILEDRAEALFGKKSRQKNIFSFGKK